MRMGIKWLWSWVSGFHRSRFKFWVCLLLVACPQANYSPELNNLNSHRGVIMPLTWGCCKIKWDNALKCLLWYQTHKGEHLITNITIIINSNFILPLLLSLFLSHWSLSSLRAEAFEYFIHSYHLELRRLWHYWASSLLFEGYLTQASNDSNHQFLLAKVTSVAPGLRLLLLWRWPISYQPPLCPVVEPCELSHLELKPVFSIMPCFLNHT